MSREFGPSSNIIDFPRTTQTLVSGNNALKAEVWQIPQARVLAPVIDINAYRIRQQEASLYSKETQDFSMVGIDRLEAQWNKELGITQQEGFYNYHPVLARWRYEQHRRAGGEIDRFKLSENQNITTALRERDHTRESRLKFVIEGNKIRAEFSDEPHEVTILRGLNYRITHGSKEVDREKSEVRGFQSMQAVLTSKDTPVNTKFFVISGHGVIKDTQYADDFVDSWEIKEDEFGKRYISYTRFSSASDYDRCRTVANTLSPNYFDHYKGPIDAWFLSHPLLIPPSPEDVDQIFDKYFERDPKAMEEGQFLKRQEIYQPYAQYYLNDLTKPSFNPIRVARDWNSLLSSPDHEEMQVKDLKDVPRIIAEFGWIQPAQIMAGCGASAGFKIGLDNPLLSNSVGKFSAEKYTGENAKNDPNLCSCGGREPHFHCEGKTGTCGHAIEVGKGISQCPSCGEGRIC